MSTFEPLHSPHRSRALSRRIALRDRRRRSETGSGRLGTDEGGWGDKEEEEVFIELVGCRRRQAASR